MTRKKWNRLRRQYPELLRNAAPFERFTESEYCRLRSMSKREVIAEFTARKLLTPGAFGG